MTTVLRILFDFTKGIQVAFSPKAFILFPQKVNMITYSYFLFIIGFLDNINRVSSSRKASKSRKVGTFIHKK